ncbi:MAG: SDR family NAD(P)-dependent oxidoreductase [Parcubacteria group bacterium]
MKTILITGASRGIGRAIAQKFLDMGDFVIGTSTSGESALRHENLVMVKLDLSKTESIKECVKNIEKLGKQPLEESSGRMTKIDILINNAGINVEDWEETVLDVSRLRETLEVNLIGLVDFTEQILSVFDSIKHIINISSRAGALGDDNYIEMPAYKISKVAVNMYTQTLAYRLKDKGTIVSSVDPEWVRTDMGGDDAPDVPEKAANNIYNLAISEVESGQFWLNGKKRNW